MDSRATVPMRRQRVSREFLCPPVPMTPDRARLHTLDTAKVRAPCDTALTTGRIEERYALKLRREYNGSQLMGSVLVVLATLAGLAVGVAVVAAAIR